MAIPHTPMYSLSDPVSFQTYLVGAPGGGLAPMVKLCSCNLESLMDLSSYIDANGEVSCASRPPYVFFTLGMRAFLLVVQTISHNLRMSLLPQLLLGTS